MLRVLLENVSTGETLDLNDISQNGEGAQAVAGATGFGLPPVEVQWFEGAGDGAQARGYRVAPRDLDIPLYIEASDRTDLKATLAKLSRVVAGAFLLKLYEDETLYRYMEVYRVAGGTYTYGSDTTGETDWQSIITVRAGNPYWLYANTSTTVRGTYVEEDSFTLTNDGSANAYPAWTIEGPIQSVTIAHDDTGESFTWTGLLNVGETLVVDTEKATAVIDGDTNVYDGLSSAPGLFRLPSGDSAVTVTAVKPVVLVRTNYATNPAFGAGSHGWTASGTVALSSGRLKVGDIIPSHPTPDYATKTISGFSAAAGESFLLRLSLKTIYSGVMSWPYNVTVTTSDSTSITNLGTLGLIEYTHPFTVPSDGQITIKVSAGVASNGTEWPIYVDNVYVGLPGAYFDGGTTDTADVTYAWTSTADASTSTATSVDSDPQVSVEFRPRDWMAI